MSKFRLFFSIAVGGLMLLISSVTAHSYNKTVSDPTLYIDDIITSGVDKAPKFPGGKEALAEWLLNNVQLPEYQDDPEFQVRLSFIVNKDGTLSDVRLLEGYEYFFDRDLLKTFSNMPKWEPGRNKGVSTTTEAVLPITFYPFGTAINDIVIIEREEDWEGIEEGISIVKVVSVENVIQSPKVSQNTSPKKESDTVLDYAEQSPSFPGGEAALKKWIERNLQYPLLAKESGVEGHVIVEFVVEKDGRLTEEKVIRGIEREVDQEALRLIRKMPRWQPGKNNGSPVRCRHTLPINFKLSY